MIKKGKIYLIEDFQEFGQVLFQLEKRLIKNIKGNKLKEPIWEGFIVDADNKNFRDYILENNNISLCFEYKLIPIEEIEEKIEELKE